jgi:hypothetical protein
MCCNNRYEDAGKAAGLEVGGKYYFNMHQDGGAVLNRVTISEWELCEIPLYGGPECPHVNTFKYTELLDAVNYAYDVWI